MDNLEYHRHNVGIEYNIVYFVADMDRKAVQRVAKIVASWVAASFFFHFLFLIEKYSPFFGKRKSKN